MQGKVLFSQGICYSRKREVAMIMYRTEMYQQEVGMEEFIAKYQDIDKFMAYCRACPNYNARWSCPPLSFDVGEMLAKYSRVHLVGLKMTYDAETIASADTPEKVKQVTWDTLFVEKRALEETLLIVESENAGSMSLSSGGCHYCETCARAEGQPCTYPDKMRYSLDAFGFDLTAITADQLGIDLCWSEGALPPYYTLIHALLLPAHAEVDENVLAERIRQEHTKQTAK